MIVLGTVGALNNTCGSFVLAFWIPIKRNSITFFSVQFFLAFCYGIFLQTENVIYLSLAMLELVSFNVNLFCANTRPVILVFKRMYLFVLSFVKLMHF